ncbi:hypothetical protein EOD42_12980 [Rhodovarius crocodyli]|uniref:GIY-YIG domain-containing protein n=1 Tax=Rhodovarius crocodyli TaxID=1979269 RepID=A0A437MEJ6_9PROT|nr:hypothetical protein [Rhodovarius crocodyli]RVT96035.1 hypothetical protein EOD42_12980 [Rhodovarius crocodyli]
MAKQKTLSKNIQKKSNPKEEFQFYGDWLIYILAEKEMSVPDLAAGTGLSATAIYKIRDKITSNPQNQTKELIEKFLKSSPGTKTKTNIHKASTVEGIGELQDFDPNDPSTYPAQFGVYVFYDSFDRPVYIGSAVKQTIATRTKQHKDIFWFKPPIVAKARFLSVDDEQLAKKIEKSLIGFFGSYNFLNKKNAPKRG